jgi:FkbM family methyltransferase
MLLLYFVPVLTIPHDKQDLHKPMVSNMDQPMNGGKHNISFRERIKSWVYFLKRYPLYPIVLTHFYRAYDNYLTVTVCFWRKRYPIKAVLRNGKSVTVKNERTLKFPWYTINPDGTLQCPEFDIKLDTEKEISTISSCSKHGEIILKDSINNGDVYEIFLKGQYRILPVSNAVVIDVGANIGDSSIYFALRGAKSVVAVDPVPHNYMVAIQNVRLNRLSKKISIILGGCASETSFANISCTENSILSKVSDGTQVKVGLTLAKNVKLEKYFKVKLFSLTDLLDENDIDTKAILKMDCEGCEYGVILSSPVDTLKRFSHIFIEYHYGYKDLRDKLLSCGFKVSISPPTYVRTHDIGEPMYAGVIFAVNN